MTQEQGSELNGRFTAVQLGVETIRGDVSQQTYEILPVLTEKTDHLIKLIGGDASNPISNIVSGIHNTLAKSYLALQDIRTNTGEMRDMWAERGYLRKQLDAIKNNTDKWNKK